MTEPRTQAGRSMLEWCRLHLAEGHSFTNDKILAIEQEAGQQAAAEREKYRHGWCCDFDFDNGTYRTTSECIGRTRNADAVEAKAAKRERARLRAEATAAGHNFGFVEWLLAEPVEDPEP